MKQETSNTALILNAIAFAAHKHKDQRRKDVEASPYINHPIALANCLANEAGIEDIEVLCGAILHDTIEDTQTSEQELIDAFGINIAKIVVEVSDDKSLPKAVRKQAQIDHAAHISVNAKLVKLADKISNLRDIIAFPPANWDAERKRLYFEWAAMVVANVRGTNATLEAIFDGLMANKPA
ncbi:MAG: spoTC [Hyphomonadaceae bacterium]|nr:MAG: spoTC [Hyphomonadaceae bacterium]KAF0186182.1 MAG: spoTC [Hyphomonadaceae bacterium]